ncbi:MAG: beta-hexosaminidase [Clostridia bacterium]|nr:beta-hexosaminidase [Clostridia bacterium]
MKKKYLMILLIIIGITMIMILKADYANKETTKYNNQSIVEKEELKSKIPEEWQDNGIFKEYYELAYEKLQTLTLDEKIGQIFLVSYPNSNQIEVLEKYQFGGYLFFEKDFRGKTKQQVQEMIQKLQKVSKIPILTAVDEEGGTVVRISSNKNLRNSKFLASKELYKNGGFSKIKEDTIEKSKLLEELKINLNLAPVVDIATSSNDYMYKRSLGKDASLTATYAKTIIEASKNTSVSYTLKHFPGYGNNVDTHTGKSVDKRSYEEIYNNDLLPFRIGIQAGAEAVLISHNIVTSIDSKNPASLSKNVHELLRKDLNFTGIIITDDLTMAAVSKDEDIVMKAILAGNSLIIVSDYENSIYAVKEAIKSNKLSEETINQLVFRILAWKYSKNMIVEL